MSNETDLNTALHRKMTEEQQKYKEWLFTLAPEKILDNAYEYAMREDILLSIMT